MEKLEASTRLGEGHMQGTVGLIRVGENEVLELQLQLRRANMNDHEFLIEIDLKNDGYTNSENIDMTEQQKEEHREKIKRFLTDEDKCAFVYEDLVSNKQIGEIMYTIANRDLASPWTIFNELNRSLFQSDGRFMEIFSLWIHPDYRRLGLATQLKLKLEEEAEYHKVNLIYTHTEEKNQHVIELNKKIGYQEVRRGPIWDEVIRVSLIKSLTFFKERNTLA